MASYEIEEFLVATFDKGVTGKAKSKVHTRQLAKLNDLLKDLRKSPAFFEAKNTRGYLYDLKNSLDECLRLSRRWVPVLIHPVQYRSVCNSLGELRKKLQDEYKDLSGSPQDGAAAGASQESIPPTDTAAAADVEGKEVHGFMEELVAVERLVVVPGQQDGFKAVGIAGNAGVGKTTLCEELLKRQEVRDLYVPRIYVHLPDKEQVVDDDKEQEKSKEEKENDKLLREGNEKEIVLVSILKKLGVEQLMIDEIRKEHNVDVQTGLKEKNVVGKHGVQGKMINKIQKEKNVDEQLLAAQRMKIEKTQKELDRLSCAVYAQLIGKKYLIVLDNVTSDAKWFNELAAKKSPQERNWGKLLAYALPKGYGGMVVVTSRRLRLVNNMVKVDANVHRLVPRADKDFVLKMFKDSVDKQGLQFDKPLEKEIIKKCAGFPLAAKMMGEIMQEIPALKELIEEPPKDASTENATPEESSTVASTEDKTTEEPSKASSSEIQEEEQPKESQEEKEEGDKEDENADGVPPSDED